MTVNGTTAPRRRNATTPPVGMAGLAMASGGLGADWGWPAADCSLALILWRGHLNVWLSGLVLLLVATWLWLVWRRLLTRVSRGRAAVLLAPKVMVAALLALALFEPVWSREQRDPTRGRLVALLDVSGSMDVADDGRAARLDRARQIVGRIRDNLPAGVQLETMEFDTELRDGGSRAAGAAGTDLAGALVALTERGATGAALGVVALTDGGDEKVEPAQLPAAPLTIIGVGADPARWDDVAIDELTVPATVEKEVEFEVMADLTARMGGGRGFGERLAAVPVRLEEERGGAWRRVGEQTVDLTRGRTRARFKTMSMETGWRRYRVAVAEVTGEVSFLNNARAVTVDVQKKSLHVLYFTRELGMDFKLLRAELGRDPGIRFTALFRTLSERFSIQVDRLAGDEELEAGFPTSAKTLQLFDCVIIGSFPATDWNAAQTKALTEYVEAGGAVVWLGGEKSFGRGGYTGPEWAGLFPWSVTDSEPPLATGQFPVSVPAAVADYAAVAGVRVALERAGETVESLNLVGPLQPGAVALVVANIGTRNAPVIAMQAFGKGKALAVASNTLWKWANKGEESQTAFGRLWRQTVRDLTGKAEGGRVVAVRWDKESYRPGEQAGAEIRVAGEQVGKEARLAATVATGTQVVTVAVEPVPGQTGMWSARLALRTRGEYTFRLVVYQGEQVIETYEKMWPVAPLLAEGAHLELDEEFLRKLAVKGGGAYVRETEVEGFLKKLAAGVGQRTVVLETPVAETWPWYFGVILVVLVLEWIVRRRLNLF